MHTIIKKLSSAMAILLTVALFNSCVKKDLDAPPDPAGIDPNITVTTTIADLKAMYTIGGVPVRIVDELVVSGIVTADDRSGNFYKQLIIQDETAGIAIQLDQSDYYTDYPVGRRVFIKLRNLYLGEYNELIQLGGYYTLSGTFYNVERIPLSLVSHHIIKGSYFHPVVPKPVSIFSLSQNTYQYQNTLVSITDIQFDPAFIGKPYSNGPNLADINMEMEDCCGNIVLLRTSDYATFGYQLTPSGKGNVIGVFQVFGSDNQLKIRDLSDVSLTGPRCGAGSGSTIGTGSLMTVNDIRNSFTGCAAVFAAGTKVRGVVISDLTTANINSYNMVMQDGASGIVVRFYSPNIFGLNDSVEIDLSGDSLTTFGGVLQISSVDLTDATLVGTGSVVPRTATIQEVYDNKNAWESTLVRIDNVTFAGTGTYSGSVDVTDNTGTIEMYTRSGATFSGASYPASGSHSVTAYINQFNGTPELNIRSTADVQ